MLRVLLASSIALAAGSSQAFEPFLESLWSDSDTDSDDKLDLTEWNDAVNRLAAEHVFTDFGTSPEEIFYQIAGMDNMIDQSEAIDWATNQALGKDFAKALVGIDGLDGGIDFSSEAPTAIKDAATKVTREFTLSKNLMDLKQRDRDEIKGRIATQFGVSIDAVICTFSAGSVVVKAEVYAADATQASTIESAMAAIDTTQADTLMGCAPSCVTGMSSVSTSVVSWELPSMGMVGLGVAALVLAGTFTWIIAMFIGKKTRTETGQSYNSCCSDGCCSYNAARGWACGNIMAFIFLLSGAISLYVESGNFVDAIKGLLAEIVSLGQTTGPGADALSAIPMDIVDQATPYLDYVSLIIMLPGVVGAVFLLFAALLGCRRKSTMCMGKCCVALSDIVLIVAFVLYIIFAASGIVLGLPVAQEQVSTITGICETKVPQIAQIATNARAAYDAAVALPAVDATSLSDMQTELLQAEEQIQLFAAACIYLNTGLTSISELFVPSFVCVCAILLAFWTNHGLCCAASCCRTPSPALGKVGDIQA